MADMKEKPSVEEAIKFVENNYVYYPPSSDPTDQFIYLLFCYMKVLAKAVKSKSK